jgi:hypothetical protein
VANGNERDVDRLRLDGLQKFARWWAVLSTAAIAVLSVVVLTYVGLSDRQWVLELLKTRVRAVVGIPMAAAGSFCVVIILEATSGRIEFEAPLGFKFKGASGPVVLWIFAFLAFIGGIHLLW